MTGEEQAKATADRLREENEKKQIEKQQADQRAVEAIPKRDLAADNERLREMMKQDAQQQTEEDGGLQPWLKVFDSARSTYSLRDGSAPHHGFFFYQPEEVEIEEPLVHILTISRGFRMEGMKDKDGKIKYPFTQIISGVWIDEGKLKPFWTSIQGMKRLNALWEFRNELSKKARGGISKFALVIRMKTKREVFKDDTGTDRVSQIITFNFIEDENKNLEIVRDIETYTFLKAKREEEKQHLEDYIARKEVVLEKVQPIESTLADAKGATVEGDSVIVQPDPPEPPTPPTEAVSADDIPF